MTLAKAHSTLVTTILLSALSGLGTAVGIGAQLSIIRELGVGVPSDIYFVGLSAPLLAIGVISGSISYSLVPALVKARVAGYRFKTAHRPFLRKSASITVVGLLLGLGLSYTQANLRAIQAPIGNEILIVAALGWLCVAIATLTALMSAILHAEGLFVLPAAVSHLPQFFTLVWCLVANVTPSQAAAALTLGQATAVLAIGWRCLPLLKSNSPSIFWALKECRGWVWVIASMLIFVSFGTIDSIVAAGMGAGSVSSLSYGQRMAVNLAGVVVNSIGVIMLPVFSKLAAENDWVGLSFHLGRTFRMVIVALFCPAATIFALHRELISLLLYGTSLRLEEQSLLANSICSLVWGVIPMSCATILFRALYAQASNRVAGFISLMGVALYFGGSLLVVGLGFGVEGVGAVYGLVWTVVITLGARYVGVGYSWRVIASHGCRLTLQIGLALSVVFSALWFLRSSGLVTGSSVVRDLLIVALGTSLAVVAYTTILFIIGNREVMDLLQHFRTRVFQRFD